MADRVVPQKLRNLHDSEEELRQKSVEIIKDNDHLVLHICIVEHAMDLADILRQFATDDEDIKVVQVLGMRLFNAFGASVKLALSGYTQNSALIMRDIMETIFLLDLFRSDRAAIECWRVADKKERMKNFSPIRVREALDARDGLTGKKRAEQYELFSELAAHPTMKSVWMMMPEKDGDAVIGPYVEATALQATISEMGRFAFQAGEVLNAFFPEGTSHGVEARLAFARIKRHWWETFYPQRAAAQH